MQVRKRNGNTEPVDVNKIVRAVERWADGLADIDPLRVALRRLSTRDDRRAYQVAVTGSVTFDDDF